MKMRPGHRRKVYVAWKRQMLHDETLHDVIDGHQAYIHRFMGHLILQLLRPRVVSRLCDEIIKSLRSEQITVLHLQRAQPEVGKDPSLETFSNSSSGECEIIVGHPAILKLKSLKSEI